ncbi:MAG TPA: universal stress protein [Ktedonobacteraceae bacterium]|nr:universal stress protein [Ktedonobacteraceae bacterium]
MQPWRYGLKRWMLGSVAEVLARHSPAPVLVLREGPDVSTVRHDPLRALVALDGSPFAEAALVPAAHCMAALAAPGRGALHLMQVVTGPASYRRLASSLHSDPHIVGRELRDARAYLSSAATRLRKGELADLRLVVTWSIAVDRDVASTLIKVAEYGRNTEDFDGCDLIALATHGRSGVQRLVMGSIAQRILGATKLPLLLVRPQETVAGHEQEIDQATSPGS